MIASTALAITSLFIQVEDTTGWISCMQCACCSRLLLGWICGLPVCSVTLVDIVYDNDQYGRWLPDFWAMLIRRFSSLQKCQKCGLSPTNPQCPGKLKLQQMEAQRLWPKISWDKLCSVFKDLLLAYTSLSPKIWTLQSTLPASIQLVADSNLVYAAGIDKLLERMSLQQDYFFLCICPT